MSKSKLKIKHICKNVYKEIGMIKILKAHVSLNVKDLEKSVEFYRRLFEIEPVKIKTDYAKFDLQKPPLNFVLNQSSPQKSGSLSHLGIQVASTEEVLAIKSRWERSGLAARDEMQTNCCYALQDKTWVRDPDGNEWEVFVVSENGAGTNTQASECCPAK